MRLGVNIDHVATLRQARGINLISPIEAAKTCLEAGADSIVAHLREDRRHIQDADVVTLRKTAKHFNLEMSINKDIVNIARRIKPDVSTLVPERRKELTTEGGLDVITYEKKIAKAIEKLKSVGIRVSLFIDPVKKQIETAKKIGADIIELHTGKYADTKSKKGSEKYLAKLQDAAIFAKDIGFVVAAGHGLDYSNTADVVKIREIEELNIGYSIICHAVFVGLENAVSEMRKLIDRENIYSSI
ncbi:MAG: pyridoxine 5'-phosphate synthase [Candidatus Omnitrophota bacterium]